MKNQELRIRSGVWRWRMKSQHCGNIIHEPPKKKKEFNHDPNILDLTRYSAVQSSSYIIDYPCNYSSTHSSIYPFLKKKNHKIIHPRQDEANKQHLYLIDGVIREDVDDSVFLPPKGSPDAT